MLLFSNEEADLDYILTEEMVLLDDSTNHRGMKLQELQAEKDKLLVESSDILGVSLHVAGVLLKYFDFDSEALTEAYITDPDIVYVLK